MIEFLQPAKARFAHGDAAEIEQTVFGGAERGVAERLIGFDAGPAGAPFGELFRGVAFRGAVSGDWHGCSG